MGETRVPPWYAATGLHGENGRVYDSFREFLHHLPMSYTELAARIGVSQPAVSRWASAVSHPSLDEMSAAYAAVATHLEEIHDYLDRFGAVLRLVEEALDLHEVDTGPVTSLDPDQRDVTNRLRVTLGLGSDPSSH